VAHVLPVSLPPLNFQELESGDVATSLDTGVYFAFDSAELTAKARAQLRSDLLPRTKEFLAEGGRAIFVQGHTDGLGSSAYNLRLSRERAESVAVLLRAGGIAAESIQTKGFGEAGAEDDISDPSARRVVVILHGGAK